MPANTIPQLVGRADTQQPQITMADFQIVGLMQENNRLLRELIEEIRALRESGPELSS